MSLGVRGWVHAVDLMRSRPDRSLPRYRAGLSSFVAVVAVAAMCLVLGAPALADDRLWSIRINEVESEGVADFIELVNTSEETTINVSGLVLKDDDDSRTLAIPAGTSVHPEGYLAVDTDVPGGFALGGSDRARVFLPDGTTQIDGHSWTAHAATSFGRCPDGTGAFVPTDEVTKGGFNWCRPASGWPGSESVTAVDEENDLGADVSGLEYEGSGSASPGVLWAVDADDSLLLRLVWDGAKWARDTAEGWSAGKALRYPSGAGAPDAEGLTLTDAGAAGGVFVSSERNNANNTVSRISVLRYDVSGAGTTLTATRQWNLTPDLPAFEPDAGVESVEWVPDSYLVESGFVDQATGLRYDPATYPGHGTGVFFVEGNGIVYAYALDQTSASFTRVATFASGFQDLLNTGRRVFAALHWDSAESQLWVVCNWDCHVQSRVFEVETQENPAQGSFVPVEYYQRPMGIPSAASHEGFTIAPASECVNGSRPVFWAQAGNFHDRVLYAGAIFCAPPTDDFNGDGFADLAVGVPDEDVGAVAGAGAVTVIYGSASGLVGAGSQQWHQDRTGIADSAETGDHFGAAVAVGDLNRDGRSDLIVGAPDEDVGAMGDAGVVHVLLGAPTGLTATGSQYWHQDAGIAEKVEAGDRFGAALAAADYSGDGRADVAIGAPTEDIRRSDRTSTDAGLVHVLHGAAGGLTTTLHSQLAQGGGPSGIENSAENGDRFGATLAAGHMGGSREADLAIGVPGEDIWADADAGGVHVLMGPWLSPTYAEFWHQESTGVADSAEPGDGFGSSLAVGNVGGSSRDDLVIGADREDRGGVTDAGVVHVLPAGDSHSAVTATGSQLWHQDRAGVADSAEDGDRFGQALAIGEFDGDAHSELAVGVPHEDGFGGLGDAGVVHVLAGSASFLSATGSQFWHQNSGGIADNAEAGDMFGASLATSPFKSTVTHLGLAVGAPGESVGAVLGAGAVNVIYRSASGLAPAGNQIRSQNSTGMVDSAETDDHFGAPLR
jgi:hypothetical protein